MFRKIILSVSPKSKMEITKEKKLIFIYCCFSLCFWSKVDHPATTTKVLRNRNTREYIWLRYLDPVNTFSRTLSKHSLFAWKEWMLILLAIWKIVKTLFLLYNKITFAASCYCWLFQSKQSRTLKCVMASSLSLEDQWILKVGSENLQPLTM